MSNLPTREAFEVLAKKGFAFANVKDNKELEERGAYLACFATPRCEDDFRDNIENTDNADMPDIPGYVHEDFEWFGIIDLAKSKMLNWNYPIKYRPPCCKVCDGGYYAIYDKDGNALAGYSGYVPSIFPDEHWGDYLRLEVNPDGFMPNWKNKLNALCQYNYGRKKTTHAANFLKTCLHSMKFNPPEHKSDFFSEAASSLKELEKYSRNADGLTQAIDIFKDLIQTATECKKEAEKAMRAIQPRK